MSVDLHDLANGISRAEEGLSRLRAQHADLIVILNIQPRQITALCDLQIVAVAVLVAAVLQVGRAIADEVSFVIPLITHVGGGFGAIADSGVAPANRRHTGDVLAEGVAVVVQVGEVVLADVVALFIPHIGIDVDVDLVAAHGGVLFPGIGFHALHDGNDGHDRRDADEDAENSEEGTSFLSPDGLP